MTPLPKAKLQLLYLIHKADTPARYEELVEACVDWLPYFDFQLSLNELVEQGLIAYKYGTDSNRRIVIQDKGRQILSVFEKEIPYREGQAPPLQKIFDDINFSYSFAMKPKS